MTRSSRFLLFLLGLSTPALSLADQHGGNWLHWRGPLQTGVSLETYENGSFNSDPVWEMELMGRGTPVIHDGQMYVWGYRGAGADLEEVLLAANPKTGE
ncbi:MAG: hypothetical protein AAGJ31_01105, partial [Verrucomicrobiota bacterium]